MIPIFRKIRKKMADVKDVGKMNVFQVRFQIDF